MHFHWQPNGCLLGGSLILLRLETMLNILRPHYSPDATDSLRNFEWGIVHLRMATAKA